MRPHVKSEAARGRKASGSAEAAIRRALLRWFRRHARSLPWRKSRDPYAVWVSEVMLQQTQVATVIPYFTRFLEAFPTLSALARAPLDSVLRVWSGLGYYRRVRHLHRAAKELVSKFGGAFPRDYRRLCSLPGIGDYTGRAILSIAFNQPYAVLDGNVARVLARLGALRGNLHRPSFRRAVESRLELLISRRRPGDFNQSMMELGQTLCLPRAPRCPVCPVRKWCSAYGLGNPGLYPEPRPKRASEFHELAAAIIRRGRRVAMVRGLADGLLDDLWNFPSAFGSSRDAALAGLGDKLASVGISSVADSHAVAELHHRITYRSIHVLVYPAEVSSARRNGLLRWLPIASLPQAPISQLARKIAQQVFLNRACPNCARSGGG